MQGDGASESGSINPSEKTERQTDFKRLAQESEDRSKPRLIEMSFRKKEDFARPKRGEMTHEDYLKQDALSADKLREPLSDDALRQVVDTAVAEGKSWTDIEAEIGNAAEDVAKGEIVNIVGRELVARINDNKESHAQRVPNAYNRLFRGFAGNYFVPAAQSVPDVISSMHLYDSGGRPNPALSNERINQLKQGGPDLIGVRELIGLLDSSIPNSYAMDVINATRPAGKESYTLDGKRADDAFITKMVTGITFLQTMAENPDIKQALEDQMGLSKLGQDHPKEYKGARNADLTKRLSDALAAIKNYRGDTFAQVMTEAAAKKTQDQEMAKELSDALPNEVADLKYGGIEDANLIRAKLLQDAMEKITEMTKQQQDIENKKAKLAEVTAQIQANGKKTQRHLDSGGFLGRLKGGKMKDDELQAHHAAANAAISERNSLDQELREKTVDESEKQQLEQRKVRLEELSPKT